MIVKMCGIRREEDVHMPMKSARIMSDLSLQTARDKCLGRGSQISEGFEERNPLCWSLCQ